MVNVVTQAGYSEDALIEQPAIRLLTDLGWEMADCLIG